MIIRGERESRRAERWARLGIAAFVLSLMQACGGNGPTDSPSPTPITVHRFEAITGRASGRLPAPTVEVIDAAGIVAGVRSREPDEIPQGDSIFNPDDDLRRLVVGWGGSGCDTLARLTITRGSTDRIEMLLIRHVGELIECDLVAVPHHVVLELSEDLPAASVDLDEQEFPGQLGSQPWGPLAVVAEAPPAPNDNRIAGSLEVGPDCVTLHNSAGTATLVFPEEDTGWQPTDNSIWFRDGVLAFVHLVDGKRVYLAGARSHAGAEWVVRPHTSCPPDVVFVGGVLPTQ